MNRDDEKFEAYLREFRPRHPGSLPLVEEPRIAAGRRLAAVVLIALAVGGSGWTLWKTHATRKNPGALEKVASSGQGGANRADMSLVSLTKLALENPNGFDSALTDASRRALPNFRGAEGTLRVLAKE